VIAHVIPNAKKTVLTSFFYCALLHSNPFTEVGMTSGAVEHLRPSLRRRAKEVDGRAAGEKAPAGDKGK
jgi:hypothetical protein